MAIRLDFTKLSEVIAAKTEARYVAMADKALAEPGESIPYEDLRLDYGVQRTPTTCPNCGASMRCCNGAKEPS